MTEPFITSSYANNSYPSLANILADEGYRNAKIEPPNGIKADQAIGLALTKTDINAANKNIKIFILIVFSFNKPNVAKNKTYFKSSK